MFWKKISFLKSNWKLFICWGKSFLVSLIFWKKSNCRGKVKLPQHFWYRPKSVELFKFIINKENNFSFLIIFRFEKKFLLILFNLIPIINFLWTKNYSCTLRKVMIMKFVFTLNKLSYFNFYIFFFLRFLYKWKFTSWNSSLMWIKKAHKISTFNMNE